MSTSDQWYYQHAGQSYGPIATDALRWMIQSRQFAPDLPIRQDPAQPWQPARSVPALGLPAAATPATPSMPVAKPAPPAADLSYASAESGHPASFMQRVAAMIYDDLIVGFPVGGVIWLFAGSDAFQLAMFRQRDIAGRTHTSSWFLLVIGIMILYGAILESSPWQRTLGKRIMGLRVTSTRYARISFLRALLRQFLNRLALGLWAIGLLIALFTPRNQGIHDLLLGTLVLRNGPPEDEG